MGRQVCPNCGSGQKKHDEVACGESQAWLTSDDEYDWSEDWEED